jgi:hypothetical protein
MQYHLRGQGKPKQLSNLFRVRGRRTNDLSVSASFMIGVLLIAAVTAASSIHDASYEEEDSNLRDIQTSSNRFFGPAFLSVKVIDTAKKAVGDQAKVTIQVIHNAQTIGSNIIIIPGIETSGIFEFFITTSDTPSVPISPMREKEPVIVRINPHVSIINNTNSSSSSNNSDPANRIQAETNDSFVTITGTQAGSITKSVERAVQTSQPLQDGDTIQIYYEEIMKTVNFSKTVASARLDRMQAGAGNMVHLYLVDPDGNIDPTAPDNFPATSNIINAFGATLTTGNTNFTETGTNT